MDNYNIIKMIKNNYWIIVKQLEETFIHTSVIDIIFSNGIGMVNNTSRHIYLKKNLVRFIPFLK